MKTLAMIQQVCDYIIIIVPADGKLSSPSLSFAMKMFVSERDYVTSTILAVPGEKELE